MLEPAGLATSYLALRDVHHTRHEDVAQRDAHREALQHSKRASAAAEALRSPSPVTVLAAPPKQTTAATRPRMARPHSAAGAAPPVRAGGRARPSSASCTSELSELLKHGGERGVRLARPASVPALPRNLHTFGSSAAFLAQQTLCAAAIHEGALKPERTMTADQLAAQSSPPHSLRCTS